MKLFELFEREITKIDVANEVAEKLFMTDGNGNPIIGQFIPGYEGMNYQSLVSQARAAANANPRKERKAIDDLVDAQIKKHLQSKKAKEPVQQPPKAAAQKPSGAPVTGKKPAGKDKENIQLKGKGSDSNKMAMSQLKGKAGEMQAWLKQRMGSGFDLADKMSKAGKK